MSWESKPDYQVWGQGPSPAEPSIFTVPKYSPTMHWAYGIFTLNKGPHTSASISLDRYKTRNESKILACA